MRNDESLKNVVLTDNQKQLITDSIFCCKKTAKETWLHEWPM